MDKRINELSLAAGLDGTEKVPIDQGGTTVYVETATLMDTSDKQDINAQSTLYLTVTTLDAATNYTLTAQDKNKYFTGTFAVGRNFIIPAGLATVGGNEVLNIGACFEVNNRTGSAASLTFSVGGITFEGSTTLAAGATAKIRRIATNVYVRS